MLSASQSVTHRLFPASAQLPAKTIVLASMGGKGEKRIVGEREVPALRHNLKVNESCNEMCGGEGNHRDMEQDL